MRILTSAVIALTILVGHAAAQPYDFSEAEAMLTEELPNLDHHVAVIVRQDGVELFRYQAGDINYDTQTHLASFTKTISAGVVLALWDEGRISLDERLGDTLTFFNDSGIGEPTILDCWSMRQGFDTPVAYERDSRFTLIESVGRIGITGFPIFEPGTQLGYDGVGMQSTARICELRTGLMWEAIARTRIFNSCEMPQADYQEFHPNPAVAGGLRSTAEETMNYAQMILDGGLYNGARVLSEAAIDQMFVNNTRGLPVYASPWPETHELYPYGVDPDYGFGDWILAEHPATQHVEEIVGAGAWGSYIWIDRRRGLTAVLITDIQPTTQTSMYAALRLCEISRQQVEGAQAHELRAVQLGTQACLSWEPAAGSLETRIYASDTPIRDIYELRDADLAAVVSGSTIALPYRPYYAAVAVYPELENTALIPGGNASASPTPTPDLNMDDAVNIFDFVILALDLGNGGPDAPGDVDGDGDTDLADVAAFQKLYGFRGW
jgi:CubicO group peptidase (beta-lactamase class C family)